MNHAHVSGHLVTSSSVSGGRISAGTRHSGGIDPSNASRLLLAIRSQDRAPLVKVGVSVVILPRALQKAKTGPTRPLIRVKCSRLSLKPPSVDIVPRDVAEMERKTIDQDHVARGALCGWLHGKMDWDLPRCPVLMLVVCRFGA